MVYMLVTKIGSSFGGKVKYSEMADMFKEIGITVPKQFFTGLLSFLLTALVAAVLMVVVEAVCRRKADFSQCANMLASAFLPAGILMCISIVMSLVYPPISLILFAGGYISFIILAYLGMQKLDKFESSPFWFYIIFALIVTAAGIFISLKFTGTLFEEMLDELQSSMSYLF